MSTVRRWYIYLVSAISLVAVGLAVSQLLGHMLSSQTIVALEATALQLAVIVIGLPIYLAHWLWAQRLAGRDSEEQGAALRWLYLYGLLAWSLGAAIVAVWSVVEVAVGALGARGSFFERTDPVGLALDWTPAILVWGALWLYHHRLITANRVKAGATEWADPLRRLYVYTYSAAGLAMTVTAVLALLARLIDSVTPTVSGIAIGFPVEDVTTLIVGLPVWLAFWLWAQRLFTTPDEEERHSTIRKFYLYAVIFAAVVMAVGTATLLLGYSLQRALGVPTESQSLGQWLAMIIAGLTIWAYHAVTLRQDERIAGAVPQEAAIRRVYLYLVAAIGLTTLLIGLAGDLSVLIRSLAGPGLIQDLRAQLAWFTAAVVAGLPVWLLAWWPAQSAAVASGAAGMAERRSVTRKIYLYLFLFAATMTILSSAVFLVSRVVYWALSGHVSGNPPSEVGHAIAFTIIAAAVWLYHGALLRRDGRALKADEAARLHGIRVAILDGENGSFGTSIVEALQNRMPGLTLEPMGLTPAAARALGGELDTPHGLEMLAQSHIVVAPWSLLIPGEGKEKVAAAIAASPARKLLIPVACDGWLLAGVSAVRPDELINDAADDVGRLAVGEAAQPRRVSVARMALTAVAGLIGLFILSQVVIFVLSTTVFR
ncbi:MAG: DUF5671 domain-containing protein [Anaerolineae bacterium]